MDKALVQSYSFASRTKQKLSLTHEQVMLLGDIYLQHGKKTEQLVRSEQLKANGKLWNLCRVLVPAFSNLNDYDLSSVMWDVAEESVFLKAWRRVRDPSYHRGWNDFIERMFKDIEEHPELYPELAC